MDLQSKYVGRKYNGRRVLYTKQSDFQKHQSTWVAEPRPCVHCLPHLPLALFAAEGADGDPRGCFCHADRPGRVTYPSSCFCSSKIAHTYICSVCSPHCVTHVFSPLGAVSCDCFRGGHQMAQAQNLQNEWLLFAVVLLCWFWS